MRTFPYWKRTRELDTFPFSPFGLDDMAILTYGSASVSGTDSPSGFSIGNLRYWYPDAEMSTYMAGDYRVLGEPGVVDEFFGYGFTYSGYLPTGGTITEYKEVSNGVTVVDLSGINVPLSTLNAWITTGNNAGAASTLLSGDDVISDLQGNATLYGYGGNDKIFTLFGNNYIDGGPGIDTAFIPALFRETSLGPNGVVSGPGFTDTLVSVEVMSFFDGSLSTDPGTPAAQIMRLYQAALGRAPDPIGLANWVTALNNGTSLVSIAAGFIGSPEFRSRFPAAGTDNTAFVTQLYQNVLHRAPDPTGLSNWTAALNSGSQSQAQVVLGFSESAENESNTSATVAAGIWTPNESAAEVARLYYSALGRAPDAAGLTSWTNALEFGGQSLTDEANGFMASPEFQSKYGSLSNGDFVSLLYNNVLGRSPDAAGLNGWTGALNAGATRASVLIGFSESPEHQAMLIPVIDARGIVTSG